MKSVFDKINRAKNIVSVGCDYTHYKGGVYKVEGVAINENTQDVDVIYSSVKDKSLWFVRPLKQWDEDISDIKWQGPLPGMEVVKKRFQKKD